MDSTFQRVFNALIDYLPEDWERVAIYYATVDGMIDFNYYVDTGSGYVNCFLRKEYDRDSFDDLTFSLRDILAKDREALPKKKRWNVFTMYVTSEGKFKVDYFYDDISKNFMEYHENWEKSFIINK